MLCKLWHSFLEHEAQWEPLHQSSTVTCISDPGFSQGHHYSSQLGTQNLVSNRSLSICNWRWWHCVRSSRFRAKDWSFWGVHCLPNAASYWVANVRDTFCIETARIDLACYRIGCNEGEQLFEWASRGKDSSEWQIWPHCRVFAIEILNRWHCEND